MRRQHIVDQENVTRAPGETERLLIVNLADLVEHRGINGRSIGKIDVARKIFFGCARQQPVAYFGGQSRDVEKMGLIEPDKIASPRMPRADLASLTRAKLIFSNPLELNLRAAAVGFDFRLVACLKDIWPGKIQPSAVVAQVHQSFSFKVLSDLNRHALINSATISQRC